MVHGEPNDAITFRIYDHNTGREYRASNAAIRFAADNMYGNPEEPYRIQTLITGLDDIIAGQVNVYPNPVSELLWINRPWNQVDVVEVVDLSGRVLLKKADFTDSYINVSRFETGVYLLKLTKDGQTYIRKINKK
jgi:hypothetical protein